MEGDKPGLWAISWEKFTVEKRGRKFLVCVLELPALCWDTHSIHTRAQEGARFALTFQLAPPRALQTGTSKAAASSRKRCVISEPEVNGVIFL